MSTSAFSEGIKEKTNQIYREDNNMETVCFVEVFALPMGLSIEAECIARAK